MIGRMIGTALAAVFVAGAAHAGNVLSNDFTGIADFGAGDNQNYEYFQGTTWTSDYGVSMAMPHRPAGLIGEANQPTPDMMFSLAGKDLYSSTQGLYDGAVRIDGIPQSGTGWRGPRFRFNGAAGVVMEELSLDVAYGRDFDCNLWEATRTHMDWAIRLIEIDGATETTLLDFDDTRVADFWVYGATGGQSDTLATLTWALGDIALDPTKEYDLTLGVAGWGGTTSEFRVAIMDNFQITGQIPAPASLAGLALLALARRRRK